MGSALETLCGQAYGAGQSTMLGVYMQRSWVILFVTALILLPLYIWSPPILRLAGQTAEISDAAGQFYTSLQIILYLIIILLHLHRPYKKTFNKTSNHSKLNLGDKILAIYFFFIYKKWAQIPEYNTASLCSVI